MFLADSVEPSREEVELSMAGRGVNRAMASPRERPPGEGELQEGAGVAPMAVKLRRRAERVVVGFTDRASPNNYNPKAGRRTIRQGGLGGELRWRTGGRDRNARADICTSCNRP